MISALERYCLSNYWGDLADAMHCFVEVKLHDTHTDFACYIYALNPDTCNDIKCIVYDRGEVNLLDWTLEELALMHNEHGEPLIRDEEFRRMHAGVLYKTLKEGL